MGRLVIGLKWLLALPVCVVYLGLTAILLVLETVAYVVWLPMGVLQTRWAATYPNTLRIVPRMLYDIRLWAEAPPKRRVNWRPYSRTEKRQLRVVLNLFLVLAVIAFLILAVQGHPAFFWLFILLVVLIGIWVMM